MACKKRIAIVAVMLLVCACLFAENGQVLFKMYHSVNPIEEHGFLFYSASKDSEISSVELKSGEDFEFARLMVIFNTTLVHGIRLDFTDLVSVSPNSDGTYNCYPYTIWCVNRSSGKNLGSEICRTNIATDSPGDIVGSIELYSNDSPLAIAPKINGVMEMREISMLYVNLDEESAVADSYAGSIQAVFTAN